MSRKLKTIPGQGYQLWETTTEGSPVSPVLESLDTLAAWCEKNATVFAYKKISKSEWLHLFKGECTVNINGFYTVTGGDIDD